MVVMEKVAVIHHRNYYMYIIFATEKESISANVLL